MKFMVFFFFRRSGIGSQYYMVCCMCVGNMSKKSVKRNYQNCVCNLFKKRTSRVGWKGVFLVAAQ